MFDSLRHYAPLVIIIAIIFIIILILPTFGYATNIKDSETVKQDSDKQATPVYPLFTQDEIMDLSSAADFSF